MNFRQNFRIEQITKATVTSFLRLLKDFRYGTEVILNSHLKHCKKELLKVAKAIYTQPKDLNFIRKIQKEFASVRQ